MVRRGRQPLEITLKQGFVRLAQRLDGFVMKPGTL
jgi:hypothetical protein